MHYSCLLELLHCVWTSHPPTLHTASLPPTAHAARPPPSLHTASLPPTVHAARSPPTLHMARQDLELTGVLRRTVENASMAVSHVSCVCCCGLTPSLFSSQFLVTLPDIEINSDTAWYHVSVEVMYSMSQIRETAAVRQKQLEEKQLRSRQRANYEHLLKRFRDGWWEQILKNTIFHPLSPPPTSPSLQHYRGAVILLIVLVVAATSHVPLETRISKKVIRYRMT